MKTFSLKAMHLSLGAKNFGASSFAPNLFRVDRKDGLKKDTFPRVAVPNLYRVDYPTGKRLPKVKA